MKLTKIAFAVVAAIGVVAVGGSWYTGKQVEEKYQQLIDKSNESLQLVANQYGIKVAIKDVKMDRHFFSTDASYRVEIDIDDEVLDIIGNDKIYHGPLPLNRLKTFNLAPVLLSMENNIKSPEQWKTVVGEMLGTGLMNVSYSGETTGEFKLSPVKWNLEESLVESSPINLSYAYDKEWSVVEGTFKWDNVTLKGTDFTFKIKDVEYDMKGKDEGYPYLGLGKIKLNIGEVEVIDTDNKTSLVKNIQSISDTTLKGERVISQANLGIDSVSIANIDFGKVKFDTSVDFDAKLMNDLIPLYSNSETASSSETGEKTLQLLAKSFKIHLNEFSLAREKGKLNTALILNMTQFDAQNVGDLNDVLKAISQSKFTLNLNRDYVENTVRQMAMVNEGVSENDAKVKAQEEVELLFANAQNSGFMAVDGDNLKADLAIDQGKVTLNGRELSDEEVQMALFMIMLGLGSSMQ